MGIFNKKGLTCLLLIASAGGTILSSNAQAEGNGVIVLDRSVHPTPIGRSGGRDTNPNTINANPSARVTGELSDADIAGVTTGTAFRNSNGQSLSGIQGINVISNPNGLPGMSVGHGGGSGGAISGTINRAMSSGLGSLGRIAGGQ
ncbi:hypothetical protein B0D71_02140 [Pseudomonas laurylsulfativorans]|uniref:Adhesin n=1 Tax=Pseudomonas laurylsulfativorans TaxID=1943631 RepID=A0A2S3VVI0_9PSED|nr:hypothetical protein [Pseudomonas laurylsulfativorans]POF43639.1 hypothetical protein B0D71_02140 [Pseudomonas laurylsulfativorans]